MLRNKDIRIFGHRGAAGLAFENTLQSIQRGLDEGVNGIEIDVWKTVDNEVVVFHDTYLDRLTEHSGLIRSLSSNDIRTIRLKNGDRIPALLEVIQLIKKSNTQLLVEIKAEDALDLTLTMLKKNLDASGYIVGSFFHSIIKQCKDVSPEVQTAIMFECVPLQLDEYLEQVNPDYIVTSIETYNQYLLDIVKAQGRKLLFYTVNTPPEMELAIQAAPYGIITNYPDLFAERTDKKQ
jgi:glycerophosphoryl diester phosphodiesterase